MAILTTDITFNLSGGAPNADPDASLGGAISNNAIVDGAVNNLFDVVAGDESAAGDSEYRCLYVQNNHATLTYQGAEIWVENESPSPNTDELIALGSSTIGGIEQSIADESTPPIAVAFSQANGQVNALQIGDIPPGSHKAIWIRRDVSIGASAYNNDGGTLRVRGDSAA